MKKIMLIAVLLASILLTASCGISKRDVLSYRNTSFTAEVILTKNGISTRALVKTDKHGNNDETEIVFIYPESIKGVCQKRIGNKTTITKNGITLETSNDIMICEKLLLPQQAPSSIETVTENGKTVTKVCILSGNGSMLIRLNENGVPTSVETNEEKLNVVWLEKHRY